MELEGKTVLITGGARVGQLVAQELLGAGARLAMTYLAKADEAHEEARGYKADLTREEEARQLVENIIKDFGAIDGLVNMVSVFKPDGERVTMVDMKKQFAVNAFSNMLVSRLFAEEAKKRGAKNAPMVSFIDWAVDHPYQNYDMYLAAKAGLRHYLMALQSSFRGVVRVVNIHPGMILPPPDFPEEEKEEIKRNTPTGDIGDPQQVAKLVRTALELDFLADNIHLAGGQQWRHRFENDGGS